MMNKSKVKANIIIGFGGQLCILVLGIIVPRVLLTNYGSDVTGLLSTVTQIFTYMALLEAGIGQAARNALYEPISTNNRKQISHIVSIARNYFRKLTYIYGGGIIAIAILAPFILKSNINRSTIVLVILFQGLANVISFYFIQTQNVILTADGRNYINNAINVINQIVSYMARIVLALWGVNIALIQLVYLIITVAKVFVYKYYFKNHYSWINYNQASNKEKLKDRNSYVVTELAWTIFSSTDMIVLSTVISTKLSSVYTIYNMVFSSINSLLNAVYSSVIYILGQSFHESKEKYIVLHDAFTSIFLGTMTILMCVTYVLILPFVRLYTNGVTDIEYIYTSLPIMFCLIQLLSWSRFVSGNLTGIAGYAKSTSYISLMEAIINLSLSIVFVHKYGIVGVTLATVIALPVKVLWCIYVTDKKVIKRSYWKSLLIIGVNFLLFFFVVFFSEFFQPKINSYVQFFIWGILLTVIFGALGIWVNFMANKDCWLVIKRYILKR